MMLQLLDMVKTLVKSLCNAYQLPIPSFMQQLDLDDAFEESDDDDTHPHKNHHQGKGDRDISGRDSCYVQINIDCNKLLVPNKY